MKLAFGLWLAIVSLSNAGTLDFKEMAKEINAAADVSTVTADYEFTNKTDKPITIAKSDPGCSCVSVQVSGGKLRYGPGESGIIRATFDLTNFSGTVNKAIALFLDKDPEDKPSQFLQLKVNIPVLIAMEPKSLKWELGGKEEPQVIHVRIADGQTIHVTDLKSTSEDFTCELKVLESGRSYDIVVTPHGLKSGSIATIQITTDCPSKRHRIQQAFAVALAPKEQPKS